MSSSQDGDVTHPVELLIAVKGHRAERMGGNGGQTVPYEEQWSCFISLVSPVLELEGGAGRSMGLGEPAQVHGMS